MNHQNLLTCDVTSDLMVLYATGKASLETQQLVESHLHTCAACAQAFRREPQVRGQIALPKAYRPAKLDSFLERLKYWLLPVWGLVLYAFSRLLHALDRLLRRVGISTTRLKIRIYRARRRVAGKLTFEEPADATIGATP